VRRSGFVLLLMISFTMYGMEETIDSTHAWPYLSLKEYTKLVGWQKAKNVYNTYCSYQSQFSQFRGALEKFLAYGSEQERGAFFAQQNRLTRDGIVNFAAILTDITGSHWPYTRALQAALPKEILTYIGLKVCSGGAFYFERYLHTTNMVAPPKANINRTLVNPWQYPDPSVEMDMTASNMSYKGLCSTLTYDEICTCGERVGIPYDYDFFDMSRTKLLHEMLYPNGIILSNGINLAIKKIKTFSNYCSDLYNFTALGVQGTNTIFYRDAITNMAQVGPNCVGYCRKEEKLHVVYHLDLNVEPIETKICASKKQVWIGALPYEHFVIMEEHHRYYPDGRVHDDALFGEPDGRALIVYNKHGVVIQKVGGIGRGRKKPCANCKSNPDGWDIMLYKGGNRGEMRSIFVYPVTCTHVAKNRPDDVYSFDYFLWESIKLGTTAPYKDFNVLLRTKKKNDTTGQTLGACVVS
jgi:hypothetical protein